MKSVFTFPVAARKAYVLCLLLMLLTGRSYGQACTDCPPIAECGACAGGLRNLTFQYTGGGLAISFNAVDGNGQNVGGGLLSSTITINSAGSPTQPFGGGSVTLTVVTVLGDLVASQTVNTSCSAPIYDGSVFGDFKILGGISVNGETLCCSPTEMESIPDPAFTGCPSNQSLPLISGCTRTATWTPPTATDGCGDPITVTTSHPPNFAFPMGSTVVTYTATDPYGNTNTCEFTITISDGIQPQFVNCPADRDESANGNCQFDIPDYTSLVTTTDNCDTEVTVTQSPAIGTLLTGVGTAQLITLTGTDDSNNIRTCNFTITLADQTAPQITCPGDINVAANHPTNCSYTIQDFTEDATVFDNCDNNITVVQSPSPGTVITGEGTEQIITLTAYDDIGNSSQCTFTITVIDTTLPQITCPSDKNETVDLNCEFTVPDYTGTATATDKCDNSVTKTQSPAPGTLLAGVGTTQTITLTATDNAGNIRNCNFTITLIDEISPLISCPGDFDVFTGTTNCLFSIPDYRNLATASDNCDNTVTLIQSPAPGTTMTGHGTTRLITLNVFDISGNSSSCDFTITLKDNIAPQITSCAPDQEVATNVNCEFSVPDYTGLATATDNCDSNVTITQSPSVGTELEGVGTTLFTLTATDDAGNSTTCSFEVTVIDDIDPVIINCPSPITLNSNTSSCGRAVTWTEPTASDNCSMTSFTRSHAPGNTFPVGTTTVTYTATDGSGNVSTCTFNVIVNDVTLPVITNCPTDRTVTLASTECTKVVTWTPPSATDNCSTGLTFTSTHNPGQAFPLGTTQVVYTAKDVSGNTATCSFNVTVMDDTDPQIVGCSHGAIIEALTTGACNAVVTWTPPTATDNCAVTLTSTHNPGAVFPLGQTDVTYTATDAAGNTSTCKFKVHVKDRTAPVISGCNTSDVTVVANGSCSAPVTWTAPTATDICSVTLSSTHNSGDIFPVGTTMVIYTATDGSGNVATCSFNVIVKDETDPVISGCVSSDVIVTADGSCGAIASWIEPTAFDDCPVTLVSTHSPGDIFPLGTTIVTYTATDNSGNTAICSFNVIVNDETDPVISGCISSDIIASTSNESCEAIATWIEPTALDNCSVILTKSHSPGDVFPLGTTTVTYAATDGAGNVATCAFNVVVNDETAPLISGCITSDVAVAAGGACSAIATWIEPAASDNCSVILTRTHSPGDVFPLGTTTVTYTATDGAGNVVTCPFNVVVNDETAPLISGCITSDVAVAAGGACSAIATWIEPTASDNCNVILTRTHSPGDVFPLGTTTVTYTATDGAGNVVTCAFNVVVNDETAPLISGCITSDIIVTADGSCVAIANWIEPSASDNCGVSLAKTHSPGGVFPLGTTIITYTATDNSGNTATCSFNVIVKDETAPVILGCISSDIIATTTSESCEAVVNWPELTAADNCMVVTLSSNHSPGDVFPKGTTEVTYTATDGSGNTATCTFNVIVNDETDPEFEDLVESDIVATANDNGAVLVSWDEITCFDNCGAVTITSSHDPGTDFPIGTTEVTYTATDASGNTKVYSFNVVVEDKTNPVISGCATSDIIMEATTSCEAMVSWTLPSSSDNSGTVTLTSSHTPGEFFPFGTTTVTYTATDPSGNTSTCEFNVVVTDDETAPVITDCVADITVSATASCTAIVNWTPPTATDNCSVNFTSSHQPGTVFETGTTEVTYTASDGQGNTSICKFNVIVKDEAAPVIRNCQTSDIITTTAASCSVAVSWPEPTAEDCSEFTLTRSHSPGTAFPIGTTEVTYTAEDIHGNSSVCKFNVVVEDKTPPVFSNCQEKVIVKADAACNATVSWPVPDVSDNCEVATVTSTHNPGDTFILGTTEVKYTATDIYGNISYCQFQVVVENANPPVIEGCVENIVAKAGESGEVQIDWVPPTATVQCGEVTLTGSHSPGDSFSIGTTTVEYKATDDAGNIALCTFTVNVSYEEVQFDIVNVLTPDGDGINDEWVLGNIEKFSDNKVVVVDRWGSVIFSAAGYNNTSVIWKGRNSSGTVVPTGTYFYTIAVRIGPVLQEKRGFIELIQ